MFFLWQLFFGEGWFAVFCRLLAIGCIVYLLFAIFHLNKKEQEQAKLVKEQQAVKDDSESTVDKAAAAMAVGAALGGMASAVSGAEKDAVQENGICEDTDVEMMDGPYDRAPYGGVIWDEEYSIDELIFKNGVYYYNEHSKEWEEDDENAWDFLLDLLHKVSYYDTMRLKPDWFW